MATIFLPGIPSNSRTYSPVCVLYTKTWSSEMTNNELKKRKKIVNTKIQALSFNLTYSPNGENVGWYSMTLPPAILCSFKCRNAFSSMVKSSIVSLAVDLLVVILATSLEKLSFTKQTIAFIHCFNAQLNQNRKKNSSSKKISVINTLRVWRNEVCALFCWLCLRPWQQRTCGRNVWHFEKTSRIRTSNALSFVLFPNVSFFRCCCVNSSFRHVLQMTFQWTTMY